VLEGAEAGNQKEESALRQFGHVVAQAIDALEAEGWEAAIEYSIPREQGGESCIDLYSFVPSDAAEH